MLAVTKCYCEFKNGFGDRSGILCKRNDIFEKALFCGPESFCTGPSIEQVATNGTSTLCKEGKIIIC